MIIEQLRARHAAERVAAWNGRVQRPSAETRPGPDAEGAAKGDRFGRYAVLATRLPGMLSALGLAQTVAYFAAHAGSKNDLARAHQEVLTHLEEWLLSPEAPVGWEDGHSDDLRQRILHCSTPVYYQAHGEALRYAGWLKLWSKAQLEANKQTTASKVAPADSAGAGERLAGRADQ